MALKKISVVAAPVREQVASQVRAAIEDAHFKPGFRLIERELCELLGVGRSSVREALRQLEAEGLVQSLPQVGTIVALMDQEEHLRMIFEARTVLEGLAVRLFTQRASDEVINRLEEVCREIEMAARNKDLSGVFRIKSRYYEILEEGTENSIVSGQLRVLRTRLTITRGRAIVQWSGTQAADSVIEVRRIVDAIHQRDAQAAERLALDHVNHAMERAFTTLQDQLKKSAS